MESQKNDKTFDCYKHQNIVSVHEYEDWSVLMNIIEEWQIKCLEISKEDVGTIAIDSVMNFISLKNYIDTYKKSLLTEDERNAWK